jgi:diacylglycerol kinase (ATP)
MGGDGTVSDVVNRTEPGVPLAVFPGGTSNLIGRHLRMEASPDLLFQTIAAGRVLRMDVGRAAGRLFVAMASCGFDAEVVRRVHDLRQACRGGFLGYWSYVKPILDCIRSYQYPELRVHWDASCDGLAADPSETITARWAFVCNLPNYGWGLPIAPWTDETDGLLDLCTLRRGSAAAGLWYVAAMHLGIHRRLADCTTRPVRRVRITAETDVVYQLDGDPVGRLPLDIEVVPGRMCVLLPPKQSAFSDQPSACG